MMHEPDLLLESDVREQRDLGPLRNDDRVVVKADHRRIILSGAVDTFDEIDGADDTHAWGVGVVEDGFATLTGQVRRHYQRKAAEHGVSWIAGVRGVADQVSVIKEPVPSDVAACINRAFARKAIVDESQIKVSGEGHTIYLDGTTSSHVAMETAVDTAWDAPGVPDVVNRFTLAP